MISLTSYHLIKRIMDSSLDMNSREKWITIIDCGDLAFVKEYIEYNDIHDDDDFPFIYAIKSDKLEITKILWDAGADPRATNEFEETALELTIRNPRFAEITKKILMKGIRIASDKGSTTNPTSGDILTLTYAINQANLEVVDFLIDTLSVDTSKLPKETTLLIQASNGMKTSSKPEAFIEMLKYLIDLGENPSLLNYRAAINIIETGVHDAIQLMLNVIAAPTSYGIANMLRAAVKNPQLVKELLERYKPNHMLGIPALNVAAENNLVETIRVLLAYGTKNTTALRTAVRLGNMELVKMLLSSGIEIENIAGIIIPAAAEGGNLGLFEQMLKFGYVGPDVLNEALKKAAAAGHLNIVRYLVEEKNINPSIDDEAPLRWAAKNDKINVVEYFLNMGSDINAGDGSVLLGAVEQGHTEMVKFLLARGSRANLNGSGALFLADRAKNMQMALMLIHCGADINSLPLGKRMKYIMRISQ